MALWAMYWKQALRGVAAALLIGGVGVLGCSKSEPPKADTKPESNDPRNAASSGSDDKSKPEKEPAKPDVTADDGFHYPFAKAVRQFDDPPADCHVPPAMTVAGKSVYKIYKDVAAQWDGIRFTTPEGKRIHYSATIVTQLGEIDLELRPDLAPNHVRNFVALARAGYYDQLFFDRINYEEFPEQPGVFFKHLEAGCPLGTGEDGYGSVGYWLRPEMKPADKATHTVGTVGALRGMEKDSAACKFYITLCDAPLVDLVWTIFGKVTRGLDVANKIFGQPVIPEDRELYGLRHPERPVMIQKVVIHTRE